MKLYITRANNKAECLLLSITINCEMLIHQTHKKPQETLEFKITKPRDFLIYTI